MKFGSGKTASGKMSRKKFAVGFKRSGKWGESNFEEANVTPGVTGVGLVQGFRLLLLVNVID